MPSKVSPPPDDENDSYVAEMNRRWRPVFDKYDTDQDGRISLDELKIFLQNANSQIISSGKSDIRSDFPPEVINEIMERADWDKNRHLSYQEFLNMVQAANLYTDRPHFQRLLRIATRAVVPRSQQAATLRRYVQLYNCMPPPLFMIFISLVEIAVFIYYCARLNELTAIGPVPLTSAFIYNPKRRYEAWRFASYMLIHAGAVHIFFNLLVQLLLGIPLEMVHKWWRVGLVYMSGVIGGSLGSSIVDPDTYLAGASGGVYALIAAHLSNVIINFKEMEFRWIRLAVLFVFTVTDVVVALYSRYSDNESQRTSYAAHFAGALGGLLVGVAVLRNLKIHKWEKILGWVLLVLFFLLVSAAIVVNVACPDYFPKQDW